jgi:hypothetical protein
MNRSGGDEPIRVVIHMRLEAMIGISLYSCLYFKLAKMLCFFILFLVFPSTKLENRAEQVLPGAGCVGVGKRFRGRQRGAPNNVYTYE